jgi:gliding motility-associated-like protein
MKKIPCLLWIFMLLTCQNALAQAPCGLPANLFPGDSLIICKDTMFTLALPQYPGAVYAWSTGATDTAIQTNQSGLYWVQVNDGKCTVQDSITLIFNSFILEPNADSLVLLCLNRPDQPLVAKGQNILWYDSPIAGIGNPIAPTPSTADTTITFYYVSQTVQGCESPRAAVQVEVIDKPQFELGNNVLIPCGALGVSLQTVPQKYTDYQWQDGIAGPEYIAPNPGTYILRADNICGYHIDTVVTIACDSKCMMFPNAFTPNRDGRNDVFRPSFFCPIDKYHLMIFNRYGEKVFESKTPTEGWDGRYMGKVQGRGTFIYYCIYFDFVLKKDILLKNSVTLID